MITAIEGKELSSFKCPEYHMNLTEKTKNSKAESNFRNSKKIHNYGFKTERALKDLISSIRNTRSPICLDKDI